MDMIRYRMESYDACFYRADTRLSLRENEEAYNRYKIRPRVLVNVHNVDISTEIFGTKVCSRKNPLLTLVLICLTGFLPAWPKPYCHAQTCSP